MDLQLGELVGGRTILRLFFALVIVFGGSVVVVNAVTTSPTPDVSMVHDRAAIERATSLTVVTTHFNDQRNGSIGAFNGDEQMVYRNDSYTRYFDVDPVPGTTRTVMYVAQQNIDPAKCGLRSWAAQTCVRQIIEQLNLTTDRTKRVFSQEIFVPTTDSWHDLDAVGDQRYIVADRFENRAFIINVSTGLITWEWMASTDFALNSGGRDKSDWTHINDVEIVRDGVIMASLRNQDQIVFIDRQKGLLENWTLGSENNYDVLYEQHNPDYIPKERGGPAVLIADSENNRIVEYQRRGHEWDRSWTYAPRRLEWPRDADRLPNGHTLITDTHNNRLIEINQNNDIIWEVNYPKAYDAERLGTGDESATGHSASELGLTNVTTGGSAGNEADSKSITQQLRGLVPNKIKHALLWVLPPWVSFLDIILLSIVGAAGTLWIGVEIYWASWINIQWPIQIHK